MFIFFWLGFEWLHFLVLSDYYLRLIIQFHLEHEINIQPNRREWYVYVVVVGGWLYIYVYKLIMYVYVCCWCLTCILIRMIVIQSCSCLPVCLFVPRILSYLSIQIITLYEQVRYSNCNGKKKIKLHHSLGNITGINFKTK